ncbi:MAG: hypothetical protein ACUVUG_06980 [Candidatus Aminicenantia bacterium]
MMPVNRKKAELTKELYETIVLIVEDKVKDIKVTREEFDKLRSTVLELAEAQKITEEAVKQLAGAVASLSDTIGFGLEDIARVVLPGYLERHYKISITELERKFIKVDGREVEINLYAEGKKEGKPVVVVVECKSRIYEGEVRSFYENIKPFLSILPGEPVPVLFGYLMHPSATELAKALDILVVASYQR